MSNQEVIIDSYYRSYDDDNERWIRHAFWTKASQVECADGTDVETKITEEIDAKIQELEQSFQGGCSVIADAITGGRDGNGTGGVPTAADASLQTMSNNITALALNNYNDGMVYADNRVNTNSASYHAGGDITTQPFNIRLTRGASDSYTGTVEIQAGRTLWQTVIPVITGISYWVYAGGGETAQSSGLTWEQTGNVLKISGYRITGVSGTIYYVGGVNVSYYLYAITISGGCHNKSQWTDGQGHNAEVNASVNGKVYVKVDGTDVSIYANTSSLEAASYGNWEGHRVSPLSVSISNKSMTNQNNGSFRLNVSGSGSSGNSAQGTTSSMNLTVDCVITNGALSVAPNGTVTAHANLGNLNATGSVGATAYKMI